MKHTLAITATVLCMLLMMTACGEAQPADKTATTTTAAPTTTTAVETTVTEATTTTSPATEESAVMSFDSANHWNEGEEPAAHTLDEDGKCEVCGVSIETDEDGCSHVTLKDQYGNLLKQKTYNGTTLVNECDYVYYDDIDVTYCAKDTTFYDSGVPSLVIETDQHANAVETEYNEDGSVMSRNETVYEEDGSVVRTKYDAAGAVTQKIVMTYDEHANSLTSVYDGDNTLLSTEETVYDEEFNSTSTYTFFNADGSVSTKEVWITTTDGYTKTVYDAAGNVIEEVTY